MSSLGLPVSRLINISVTVTPAGASFQNFNTLLIVGTSPVCDLTQRLRNYSALGQVATDFGTTAPEYLAATLWFGQNPAPTTLVIGRWANVAAAGQLIGGPVSATNQLIATWTAITTGAFKVSIDGGAVSTLSSLNFSTATTMNQVASIIQTALVAIPKAGMTCVWNPTYSNFIITSGTTGSTSSVSLLTSPGSGTDISAMLAGTAATGAYTAAGQALETALAAVTAIDTMYPGYFYGLVVLGAADTDHTAIAGYVETAAVAKHYYGVTTQEAGVLSASSTTDVAYLLSQLKYNHTACQYSSTNPYAIVSYLSRILTTNWAGSNTTITLMYKTEHGVTPELLTETQVNALEAKNCNVYVSYNTGTPIIEPGVSVSGLWTDLIIGLDWFANSAQVNVFNLLYGSNKVPQTDPGMNQIAAALTQTCQQAVTNGLVAPGIWNSAGFGALATGANLPTGYYIYQPPVSSQSQTARQARQSVPFQIALKQAGAVHDVSVGVIVNQ